MVSSVDYIGVRAPGYSADSRLSTMLDMAETEIGTCYGANRYKAVALLALHWLALDDRSAAQNGNSIGGTISMEQEGSLKRQYMIDFGFQRSNPDLSQTRWGMELVGLTKKSSVNFITRMVTI